MFKIRLLLLFLLKLFQEVQQGSSSHLLMFPTANNRSKPNNYLFYNRVPKCGSSSAMNVMRKLSFKLGYHWIDSKDYENFGREDNEIKEITKYLLHLPDESWAYEQHLFYIDMNHYQVPLDLQPNLINIMREPMERRLSSIYYQFTEKRTKNNSNSLNLETCLIKQEQLCKSFPSAYQACFFAGNIPECLKSELENSDFQAIKQRAKFHIENFYSVVGLTSHMKSNFKLFEAFLPKFFHGAQKIYNEMYGTEFLKDNVNTYQRNVTEDIRKLIMEDPFMETDLDVYLFATRRFHIQLESLYKNT